MAFDRTNLALDSASMNSGSPRRWTYVTTADAQATINTAGYFNDAADILSVGDVIVAKDSAASYDEYFVNANDGSTVDVDNGTAIDGGSDSD